MDKVTVKVKVAGNEEAAYGLYKKAKRNVRAGNIGQARVLFKEAQENGLPDELEERAADYLDKLDDMDEDHTAPSSTT